MRRIRGRRGWGLAPDPGKEREGAARRIWRRSRGRHAVPEEEEQGPPLPDLAPRRPPPLPELEPKFMQRPAGGPGKPPPLLAPPLLLTTGEGERRGEGRGGMGGRRRAGRRVGGGGGSEGGGGREGGRWRIDLREEAVWVNNCG